MVNKKKNESTSEADMLISFGLFSTRRLELHEIKHAIYLASLPKALPVISFNTLSIPKN